MTDDKTIPWAYTERAAASVFEFMGARGTARQRGPIRSDEIVAPDGTPLVQLHMPEYRYAFAGMNGVPYGYDWWLDNGEPLSVIDEKDASLKQTIRDGADRYEHNHGRGWTIEYGDVVVADLTRAQALGLKQGLPSATVTDPSGREVA